MAVAGDNARESHYTILLQEIEYLQDYIHDLMKENEDLEKSLKALQQERSKHQEQYFHKIKLQYNESVLTRNISRQMDLAIALSKAQEINLKLSAEIRQKHKLVKILSNEKELLSQTLQKLSEDVRCFMLENCLGTKIKL